MTGSYLPPVVIEVKWDDTSALAQMSAYRDALATTAAEADASAASMSKGAQTAGADMKTLAGSSKSYLAGDVAGSFGAVGAKADETAGNVHDSASRMSSDLAGIGAGARSGSSATKTAMQESGKSVGAAEKDVESKSRGFSGRVASVFTSVGTSMGNFGIPFGHSVTKMGEKIDEAEKHGGGFKASLESIGKVATIVGGTALVGFGAEAVRLADQFDVADVQLENAIKNTGGSFKGLQPQIEATYSRMQNLGFTNTEVATGLTKLTVATQSPAKAMEAMGLAADLARNKNISLEAATQTLTKTYAGSNRALMQLGINLNIGSGKMSSIHTATLAVASAQEKLKQVQAAVAEGTLKGAKASTALEAAHKSLSRAEEKLHMDQSAVSTSLKALHERIKGAATAFGTTLAGQVDKAKATIHNLAVEFGDALIPVLGKVAGVIASVISFFMHNHAAAIALAAVIAGPLVAAITVFIASMVEASIMQMKMVAGWIASGVIATAYAAQQVAAWVAVGAAATAAFVAENLATLGIIAAVAALVGAVVYLVTHWTDVWNTIKSVVGSAVAFVKSHLTLVMVALGVLLGPIGLLADAFIALGTHWRAVVSFILDLTNKLISGIVWFFTKLPREIINAIVSIPGAIVALWHLVESGVGKLIGGIVHFFSTLPGKVVTAVQALPGDMLTLGEDIMKAIISGVEHLASAFVDMLKKTILGPVEAIVNVVENIFGGGGGGGGKKGASFTPQASAGNVYAATSGGGSVEKTILSYFTPLVGANGAAGIAGNSALESAFNPNAPGGGLLQTIGGRGVPQGSSVQSQLESAWAEIQSRGEVGALRGAKSPAEAARIFETSFERPAGYNEAGEGGTAHSVQRERAAQHAASQLKGVIENTPSTSASGGLKSALGSTKATSAASSVKTAIETAKLNLAELKKTFATAFSEFSKISEKLFKYTLAKGGVKSAELKAEEEKHEEHQNAVAVREATGTLAAAKAGGNPTEVIAAQEALDGALYTVKIAALKREAAAEEINIARENAAKESAFASALAKLKTSLANGKTTTAQGMKEIEKVLKEYGVSFGLVGKEAGTAWVKQFEAAIKKAAKDAGAITAEVTYDIQHHIPHMAAGGLVTSPTLAVIGESGPEVVVPLDRIGGVASLTQPGALPVGIGTGGKHGLNIENFNVYGQSLTTERAIHEMYLKLRPLLATG